MANSTGADSLILHILEDVDTLKDVDIEGSITSINNDTMTTNTKDQKYYRSVKGDVIDKIEQKIKNVKNQDTRIEYHIIFLLVLISLMK